MARPIFIIRSHIRHDHDGARVDTPGASFGGPGPWLPLLRTLTTTLTQTSMLIKSIAPKTEYSKFRWLDYSLSTVEPVTLPRSLGKVGSLCLGHRLSHPEATRAAQCINRIEPITYPSPKTFYHPSPSHIQSQGSQRRIYFRLSV